MEVRRLDITPRPVSPTARGRLFSDGTERSVDWRVAEETPLAVLLNGAAFAVMMLTPEDLEDFVIGFAITEGIVTGPAEIESLRLAEAGEGFVANVRLDPAKVAAVEDRRRTLAGRAGCGLCGAQTIEAVLRPPRRVAGARPSPDAILAALAALPAAQVMKPVNHSTHAAAFCEPDGTIALVREDIGRHNALDKVAGALARDGRDARAGFLLLSSRVSVEMAQKAAAIRAPLVAAVSPPSALALRVAGQAGLAVAARAGDGVVIFDGLGD